MPHVIELSKNYPDKEKFTKWLMEQGHEVDPPKTNTVYIDGDDIDTNLEARQIFTEIKKEYLY